RQGFRPLLERAVRTGNDVRELCHELGAVQSVLALCKGYLSAPALRDVQVHDHGALRMVISQGCRHQQEPALFRWRMTGVFDRKALCPATQHRTDAFCDLVSL